MLCAAHVDAAVLPLPLLGAGGRSGVARGEEDGDKAGGEVGIISPIAACKSPPSLSLSLSLSLRVNASC